MDLILIPFITAICTIIAGYLIKNNFLSFLRNFDSESNDVVSLEINSKVSIYLIIYGLIILLLLVIGWLFKYEKYVFYIFITSTIILLITLPTASYYIHRKYLLKSNGKIIASTITGISFIIAILSFFILREPNITIDDRGIMISGSHSKYVPMDVIKEIRLIDVLPPKIEKYDGFDILGVSRGKFKLDMLDEVELCLQSQHSPYIYIETDNGRKIIFNSSDIEKTNNYYETILDSNKSISTN